MQALLKSLVSDDLHQHPLEGAVLEGGEERSYLRWRGAVCGF